MRLARPFFQLPVLFDPARLQAELAGLPAAAWVPHPDRVPGNSAARLISVAGGESDAQEGAMRPTRWLAGMPYLRQSLAGFGVVWGRARLMRLAPGAGVPEHADIAYHWHHRVRVHIPIVTAPQVRFHCDGQSVHMAAGEAWIFDNWRRHHVENGAATERIHLVADTTGTAAFWQFACAAPPPRGQWRTLAWDETRDAALLTEGDQRRPIMPAAELQLLIDDLRGELAWGGEKGDSERGDSERGGGERRGGERGGGSAGEAGAAGAGAGRIARFATLLASFVLDWRQLCALHGLGGAGRSDFVRLAAAVRAAAPPLAAGLIARTNGVSALLVLEKRVLQHLLAE